MPSTPLTRVGLAGVILIAILSAACGAGGSGSSSGGGREAKLLEPAALAKELASADKPIVVCTGPAFMYRTGHIPGAVFHGPMTSPAVHEELTAWAKTLPRNANIVIYCGCCPMPVCPNVRPAYKVLKDLGFTRVRVLNLATNFPTDWVDRGFPVER